jgi:hypothetical protein
MKNLVRIVYIENRGKWNVISYIQSQLRLEDCAVREAVSLDQAKQYIRLLLKAELKSYNVYSETFYYDLGWYNE